MMFHADLSCILDLTQLAPSAAASPAAAIEQATPTSP